MKQLKDIHILVIGDIMLDKYVVGEVERISPEAPVPIVKVHKEYSTLGGCGNVVKNIRELGPRVTCLAAVGADDYAVEIRTLLNTIRTSVVTHPVLQRTIVKERIVANGRKIQMLRVDRETIQPVHHSALIEAITILDKRGSVFDAIVVSDYAKGMISKKLMKYLNSRKERLIVDPKPINKNIYGFPFLITPNEKECKEMGGSRELILDGAEHVLETKGKRGMTLYDEANFWDIEAGEVEVYNVTGAGDTVVAVMATALSMGRNPLDSAYLANRCAAYVVTKPGTSVVPKDVFMSILANYHVVE